MPGFPPVAWWRLGNHLKILKSNSQVELNPQSDHYLCRYRRLTLMKLQYPHLKVMLSIGDLGGTMFSIVASSNRTRSRFIASVLDFCNEFNFDGVDIDWEFPGFRTGSKDDKKNFVLLLRELRKQANSAWKRKNKETKKSFLISVAVGAPLIIASTSYVIPEIGK